jgi:hypothetical protein
MNTYSLKASQSYENFNFTILPKEVVLNLTQMLLKLTNKTVEHNKLQDPFVFFTKSLTIRNFKH